MFRSVCKKLATIVFTAALAAFFLALVIQAPVGAGPACEHSDTVVTTCGNGDIDGNGERTIADAVHLLNYLFSPSFMGEPPAAIALGGCPFTPAEVATLQDLAFAFEATPIDAVLELAALSAENVQNLVTEIGHGAVLGQYGVGTGSAGLVSSGPTILPRSGTFHDLVSVPGPMGDTLTWELEINGIVVALPYEAQQGDSAQFVYTSVTYADGYATIGFK